MLANLTEFIQQEDASALGPTTGLHDPCDACMQLKSHVRILLLGCNCSLVLVVPLEHVDIPAIT